MTDPATNQPTQEFIELVQRVLDKEASLEDMATLNSTLPQDAAALSYFVKMRMLHSHMVDQLGSHSAQLSSIHDATKPDNIAPITEQLVCPQPQKLSRPVLLKVALAAAALILLSFLVPTAYRAAMAEDAYQVVATNATDEFQRNHWLTTHKTYQLSSGSIQINSPDQNFLTIQGPATFSIDSHQQITLEQGKLWAELNGKALDIHTPQGLIQDLGTTFGVDQSLSQSTRIDVFDGVVQLTSPANKTNNITKGKAVIVESEQWPPQEDAGDASLYTTKLQQSVGIAFCEYYYDVKSIEAEQPMDTRWTVAESHKGTNTLAHTPITVTWVGSRLLSKGGAASAEAALFRTHLLSHGKQHEYDEDSFRALGFSGNPDVGSIIRLENLQPWLKQIGASGYRVQALRNSGLEVVDFLPVSIRPSEEAPAIEVQSTTRSQFLSPNYPAAADGEIGHRVLTSFQTIFTSDNLTITTPTQVEKPNVDRTNISALRLIPVFD